jgi:hypothetical protein
VLAPRSITDVLHTMTATVGWFKANNVNNHQEPLAENTSRGCAGVLVPARMQCQCHGQLRQKCAMPSMAVHYFRLFTFLCRQSSLMAQTCHTDDRNDGAQSFLAGTRHLPVYKTISNSVLNEYTQGHCGTLGAIMTSAALL